MDVNDSNKSNLNQLLIEFSDENNQELYNKLNNIYNKQKNVIAILDKISNDFDKTISTLPQEINRISTLRKQLAKVQLSQNKIYERIYHLQDRLNKLRKDVSLPKQKALVENELTNGGPFYYKCIYPGGVRYRARPSFNGPTIPDRILKFNEVIKASERVFITGECSICIHVVGVGWIVENVESTRCLERCSAKIALNSSSTNDDLFDYEDPNADKEAWV